MNQDRKVRAEVEFTLFTKSWRMPLIKLGAFVKRLGFDGVELPIQAGYQVAPQNVSRRLPEAAMILSDFGLKIGSVVGPADETMIAACGQAGVPIIRVTAGIPKGKDYLTAVADCQRQWDNLLPALERHGVALGIQNHLGRFVAHAMGLHHAIGQYDPRYICAVWDPAHNALQGEDVDLALDVLWSHLRVVNLKNVCWQPGRRRRGKAVRWELRWTVGREGLADWQAVANELTVRGFTGDICLSAEYSDREATSQLISEDIRFAESLLA